MAEEQEEVYEAIAEAMRHFGYRKVTAELIRDIDEGADVEQPNHVISMFANRQLEEAREAGLLPPRPQ